jgi:hypothetical protein
VTFGQQRYVELTAVLALAALAAAAQAEDHKGTSQGNGQPGGQVNTIRDVIERLYSCWKPPPMSVANPMDITVSFSFNRAGLILGKPRITYESARATDNDRLAYRVAVMEALQRCTPMPFTETMGGAIAGYPFRVQFRTRPPQTEKKAWLSPKIL